MEGSAPPRKRTRNWDEAEKEYLMDIIRDKIRLIESKRSDAETNRRKAAAWQEVHRSFTEIYGEATRTLKQLKEQWKTMKISAKRNFSLFLEEGVEASASGDPPPRAPSELDTEVHLLMTAETKEFDPWDDDDKEDLGPPLHGELTESKSKSW